MKPSFRLVLFINILIASAILITVNRFAIQIFLPLQIKDELKAELMSFVDECGEYLPDQEDFHACIQASKKMSLIKGFTGRYVLCSEKNSTNPNDACSNALSDIVKWDTDKKLTSQEIQFSEIEISKTPWLAANFYGPAKQRTVVMLPLEDVSTDISKMLRAYRDKNTIYVLPVLLLMIFLMTWHVFNVAMRPIRQIDKSITTLDLKTFQIKTALTAPYKEFLNIVDSFEALRISLIQSFEKARRFASDASHELRTPLTILRGNAEALIKELPNGSDEQIRMQMVILEIDRLVTITQKLLWLSRADANKLNPVFQNVNLSDVMEQWVLDAQTFNPKIRLTGEIQPQVIWRCDPDLIHQLIGNLYDNAVKYNDANKSRIHFRLHQDTNGFYLSVENPSSSPLPTDFEKHAFDRFYRGDDARSRAVDGLGLGLSLCKEIATLHEAQLYAKVKDDGIVTFTLTNSHLQPI